MPHVLANDVRFHVMELGPDADVAAAPPVVMLHGLLVGNMAGWFFTGGHALAKRQRVLLYDLRGHGRSERVKSGYDLPTMTDDLEALTEGFSQQPMALVGHSYGALIALHFALRHPERVERLVLVDAPLPPARLADLAGFMALEPEEMVQSLPEPLQAAAAGGGRRIQRLIGSLGFLVFETDLPEAIDNPVHPSDAELAELRCPTLCVYGRESSCLPAGERLEKVVPGARLEIVPGGHYVPTEAATELTALLLEFVGGQGG